MTPRRRSLGRSFAVAWGGLAYAWRTQGNLRIHLAAAVGVLALARWLAFGPERLALLLLTSGAVIAAEVLNTAIEVAVDLAANGPHPLARRAKDVAAAAVLWTALVAVGVAALLFGPELDRVGPAVARRWQEAPGEVASAAALALLLLAGGLRR